MEILDKLTLTAIIKRSVRLYGNTPALSFVNDEPLSFTDTGAAAGRVAAFLAAGNISKGDKIAILSENMPNWGVAYFGISMAGGIIVPILPDFHPDEIRNILSHSESRIVFVSRKIYEKVQYLNTGKDYEFILIDDFTLIPPGMSLSDLKDAGFPYAIGYGLTETSPLIAGENAKNSRFSATGRINQTYQRGSTTCFRKCGGIYKGAP